MNGRISVISAVMNRNDRVMSALQNWREVSGIYEIILVDWSSNPPVSDRGLADKLIRVDGEENWILSSAFNLAADHASGDIIMKLDIDYRLDKSFLQNTSMKRGQFRVGSQRMILDKGNDNYLIGFLMMYRDDFFKVGGYNESIVLYGGDDTELYNRAVNSAGLEKIPISPLYGISHLEHPEKDRYCNQKARHFKWWLNPPPFTGKRISWTKNNLGNYERIKEC